MPVTIHGKQYLTVAERVTKAHEEKDDLSITTELLSWEAGVVIMKATVQIGENVYTGHASEDEAKGQINKTSALENCETSAIGRALASAGYSGDEFASANEVQNAVHQQNTVKKITAGRFSQRLQAAKDLFGSKNMTGLFNGYLKEHFKTDDLVEIVKNNLDDAEAILNGLNEVYKGNL